MIESQLSAETYATIDQIVRVGNIAVAKAQEESKAVEGSQCLLDQWPNLLRNANR